jgi:hypothetical protein
MTEKTMSKPKLENSYGQKELDRAETTFNQFNTEVQNLTLDRMNEAPKAESEQQTKISQKELAKTNDVYLKAMRTISSKEQFNEKYREDYNHKKEYVRFIAENKEMIGDSIELWTKPFAGIPAEFWQVPSNKPVMGPRYLAEQIKRCTYHRLRMEDRPVGADYAGSYVGAMVVDNTINRLDAYPVSERKSIFMGASGF